MWIRGREICVQKHLNHLVLCFFVVFLLAHSILEFIDQVNQLTIHVKPQPQVGCNGHRELCNRRYSNITQIASHGSPFIGILPTENQNADIPTQLNAGIRFLQAQTHLNAFGKLSLCHTSCLMEDAGLLEDYLSVIKEWLDTHPHEVVTLLLVNGDAHAGVNAIHFDGPFRKSGILPYAYVPPFSPSSSSHNSKKWTLDSWPTLSEMLANHTQLVTFLDTGASQSQIPYLLNEFSYFWETPFDTTDPSFSQCTVDRPAHLSEAIKNERMYIVNHFLDTKIGNGMLVPDRRDAKKTNAVKGKGSIGEQVTLCERMHGGRKPKGVLVDYFEVGGVFEAQDLINGLTT